MSRRLVSLRWMFVFVLLASSLLPDLAEGQSKRETSFRYDDVGNMLEVIEIDIHVPQAPTSLVAAAPSLTQAEINLSWVDNSSGPDSETGFVIERKNWGLGFGEYAAIGSVAANVTTYLDRTFPWMDPWGKTYSYRVRAVNIAGSSYSNEATVTTPAPPGLSLSAHGMALELSWTNNSPSASGFKIERWTHSNETYAEIATVARSSSGTFITAYSDTATQPDVTYYYRVRAYDEEGGFTDYSNSVSGSQSYGLAPSGLRLTANGMALDLSWTNNSPNASGFKIERRTGWGETYTEIATVARSPGGTFITTFSDTGTQPNVTYWYRVRAYSDAGGFTDCSNSVSGSQSPWLAPSDPRLTANGMALDLSWTNNAPNALGFKIERRTHSDETYTEIATVARSPGGAFVTAYSDTGTQPNVTYWYRVRAYSDAGGFTGYSNSVSGSQSYGLAPSGLRLTANGMALDLSWTNNAPNASGFKIERRTHSGETYTEIATVARSPGGTFITTFSDTGTKPNVTYWYRVRAYSDAGGFTDCSNSVSGSQSPGLAPSDLRLTANGMALDLSWTNNAPNASGFKIERSFSNAAYVEIAAVAKPSGGTFTTTYSDTGIGPGSYSYSYSYRVRAYSDAGGFTEYSNPVSGSQLQASAPSGLTVTANGMVIVLSWRNNSPNASGFRVERRLPWEGTYAEIAKVARSPDGSFVATYTDTTTEPEPTYFYRVRAYSDAGGFTDYSNEVAGSQVPGAAPAPPHLSLTPTGMALVLSWTNESPSLAGFRVERGNGSSGTYAEIATLMRSPDGTLATTYSDTGIRPDETYHYLVRGCGAAGGFTRPSNAVSGRQMQGVGPSDLVLTESGMALVLSWTNNAPNASGFKIERREAYSGEAYAEIAAVPRSAGGNFITAYSDTAIQPDVTYRYRVRAYSDAGGFTDYSYEVIGRQSWGVEPSDLRLTGSAMALVLSWTNNSSNASGFKVERRTDSDETYTEIATVARSSGGTFVTTFSDTGTQPHVAYWYRVRAYSDAGGFTDYSMAVIGWLAAAIGPGKPSALAMNSSSGSRFP